MNICSASFYVKRLTAETSATANIKKKYKRSTIDTVLPDQSWLVELAPKLRHAVRQPFSVDKKQHVKSRKSVLLVLQLLNKRLLPSNQLPLLNPRQNECIPKGIV